MNETTIRPLITKFFFGRLFLYRGGSDDRHSRKTSYHFQYDTPILRLQALTSDDTPNTLDSALFSLLLKPPIPQFFLETSTTLTIALTRPESSGWSTSVKTPFAFPARFYLDAYMYENLDIINQKRDEREHNLQCIENLGKRREDILRHDVSIAFNFY